MNNPFEPINNRLTNLEGLALEILQILRTDRTAMLSINEEIGGIALARQLTRLSQARIYALVGQRAIPHTKRGNRLTFRRSELVAWLEEGKREQKGGADA